MKRFINPLTLLLLVTSYCLPVCAQSDSSHLDLGSVSLERKFTQYIAIKGEDLEKMPFANLSEAINVWLYGAYSNTATLTYVVDGNIVPDVNAWSIYDIREMVFVQSALTQLTGNTGQQQLVLITTRRQNGKNGSSLRVAGESALVNTDYKHDGPPGSPPGVTNGYHQYHISWIYSREKLQLGASADYLHDVFPREKSDSLKGLESLHMNRYRLNAWLNMQVGSKSNLYVSLAASPQNLGQKFSQTTANTTASLDIQEKQLVLYPYLQFRTRLRPGLENTLSASYGAFNSHGGLEVNETVYPPASPPITYDNHVYDSLRDRVVVIRDNLSWNLHAHNWTIVPAVHLQYTYLKEHYASTTAMPVGTPPVPYPYQFYDSKAHFFTASPSLDFSYKDIFSAGGGAFAFLPPAGNTSLKAAFFPYAHLSLDLLKLGNATRSSSLQLFGSVAKNYSYTVSPDRLDDMDNFSPTTGPSPTVLPGRTPFIFAAGTLIPSGSYNPVGSFPFSPQIVWAAGLGYRRPGDRLVLNYYYEKRGFTTQTEVPYPVSGNSGALAIIYPALTAYTQHADLMLKLVRGTQLQWQSGITATNIQIKGTVYSYSPGTEGDYTSHLSWTGGWVNRFSYQRFIAGMDVLYHINEYQGSGNVFAGYQYKKINSLDLQNIYLGCKIRLGKSEDAEIYVDSRNLVQNSASDLTDLRRYYGVGCKAAF